MMILSYINKTTKIKIKKINKFSTFSLVANTVKKPKKSTVSTSNLLEIVLTPILTVKNLKKILNLKKNLLVTYKKKWENILEILKTRTLNLF